MESAAARPPHCVAGTDTLSRRRPSIFGTVGHAFDSALAEATNRAVQERVRSARRPLRRGPQRRLRRRRVDHRRLRQLVQPAATQAPPGPRPVRRSRNRYYAEHVTDQSAGSQNSESACPGRFEQMQAASD